MPSSDRESSRDRQNSLTESGRLSVPMWDSSDPDRAPPPLPLNPGSPITTRPNTSSNIQAAAAKLSERARESMPASAYTTNSMNSSPEKSLIKGAQHRRMQSMQTGSVRDLRSYLDGMRSGSPERPSSGGGDDYLSSPERAPATPTPISSNKDPLKDTPALKRPGPRPILGENTPPSSTMRALQTLAARDAEGTLGDITNGNTPRNTHAMDDLSSQLQNLTTIASNLQREMAQLSRRSKDNATDLVSLKEATKNRDEDIRKNLRELVTTVNVSSPSLMGHSPHFNRSTSSFGLGLLDSKSFHSPPPAPRVASHNSLLDPGSPNPFSAEGAASIAMLEKIIREMVTKEGQERLLSTLSDLMDKSTKESVATSKKVTELADLMKEKSESQALVRNIQQDGPPRLDLSFDSPSSGLARSAEPVNLETQKLLSRIKESVSSNGGMTAEVKALIRELRGEILGMGRELGRRLDQVDNPINEDRALVDPQASKADMEQVVREGMDELRQHMENLIEESGRQTMAITQSRDSPDGQEMYAVVKHALSEHGSALVQTAQPSGLERDDILQAVKQACEDFKPEIELQQFGLERDEILQVLKEGLEGYQQSREMTQPSALDKDDIFNAMQEAVQGLALPQPTLDMHALREELIGSVRECLKEFKSSTGGAIDHEATRDTIHEALKTGLAEHGDQSSRVMEISREDLFEAVKAGLDGSTIPFGGFGEQVLRQLNELVDGMRIEFKQYSAANGRDTEQVLDAVKDGLESLRSQIENYVDRAQDVTGKDEIVDVVRTGLEQLRSDVQGYCAEGTGSSDRNEMIDYIKAEFEHLHATIGTEGIQVRPTSRGLDGATSSEDMAGLKDELTHLRETIAATLLKSGAAPDKDDILEAVREAAANMSTSGGSGISTEQLEAIHGEFQNLKQTMVTGGSRADFEEVLDTVRLGLDDLRSHVDKKLDNPDRQMSLNSELLDALNDGLDNLRTDVTKTLEKPVDMTVNYEILDTLKEGIAGLRSDMDKLGGGVGFRLTPANSGEIVLADDAPTLTRDAPTNIDVTASDALKRNDLERMEVLLAQLQIKVEAMDANIQDMPIQQTARDASAEAAPTSALKEDLLRMEDMLKEVQATVVTLAAREKAEVENAVTKDDTDAIETLLRNTKSQIEDLAMPDSESLASKLHLDAVEEVIRSVNDTIEGLAARIDESGATKADVAVIEVMAQDMKAALDEIKESIPRADDQDDDQKMTKNDLDILGVICTEIKTKITEMVLPDVETLPTRSDLEQITGLMNDFRDGHEKFRESYERDIGVTAKAFDDRKKDTDDIIAQLAEVKSLVEDTKEDTLAKVIDGELGVAALHEALKGIEEKLDENPAVATDLKELMETVKDEFERAHGSLDGIKNDREASDASLLEKHGEHKDAIISGLTEKLDIAFDDLKSKYEQSSQIAQEKAAQQEELMNNTKEMADELKISIDTLGTALTASTATFNDATEKISEDSKTVFNRVDDTYNKLDETQEGLKAEHQATREEVSKALDGITGLQGDFAEYHPRFMMSLKELHVLVTQHYEHSQKLGETHAEALRSLTDAQSEQTKAYGEHREELKSTLPNLIPIAAAPVGTSESGVREASAIHEKLDKLVEHASAVPDSSILDKLNKLTEAGNGVGDASVQIERLDQIHQQVMATAAEVTAFVALQAKQITNDQESKEKEAEEIALILERRIAQKMQVETEITTLNDEKEALCAAVDALRMEKEALAAEKSKLNADVSSLHTALEIRREELHTMNSKADVLERRILEGLMNHSRSILLTKPKTPSPKKTRGRDLRVPSNASNVTITSTVPNLQQSHALAMKSSRPSIRRSGVVPNSNERRIMSLSQISRNVPSGGHGLSAAPSLVASRPDTLKRSHSVKQPALTNLRKASLNSARNFMAQLPDKENAGDLSDESEDELSDRRSGSYSYAQTRGTLSRGNSYYDSEGVTPYSDENDRRSSYGTSMTYGTGSYMTGSDIDRRTSLGSTIAGVIDGIDEEDESQLSSRPGSSHLDQDGGEQGAAGNVDLSHIVNEPQAQIEGSKEMVLANGNNTLEQSPKPSLGLDGATDDVQSEMFDPETGRMVTQSEVEMEVKNAIHEVHAFKSSYAPPSDSGLGTDLPTAALSVGSEGFFGRNEQ